MKKLLLLFYLLILTACGISESYNGIPDTDQSDLPIQLQQAQAGDPMATIHTTMGDIVIRLFPQYAPMTVENFITLAQREWYDGLLFYRAIPEFLIQAGIPGNNYSIWDEGITTEGIYSPLHHIRGAVAAPTSIDGLTSSSFYIIQNNDMDSEVSMRDNFLYYIENPDTLVYDANGESFRITDRFPMPILEYYINYGGMWRLDHPGFRLTPLRLPIFAHVMEGMDVVDSIATSDTKDVSLHLTYFPIEEIIIISISLWYYDD